MMFADPRRRFRFAVTIEDTDMRLWYLSRAICFVSKAFNFITVRIMLLHPRRSTVDVQNLQDQQPFVHFLISTSFATQAQMGYDPTTKRVLVHEKIVYEYAVYDSEKKRDIIYRTTGNALFNHQEYCLMGCAIRVWEVEELDSKGEPTGTINVLKDYWLTQGSRTEKQIQDEIFAAASATRQKRKELDPSSGQRCKSPTARTTSRSTS